MSNTAHHDSAPACSIRREDSVCPDDHAASREIRAKHELHQIIHRDIFDGVVIIDKVIDRADQLALVLRRDIGGHTHSDTRRTVQ
jgi:hypothetical protein